MLATTTTIEVDVDADLEAAAPVDTWAHIAQPEGRLWHRLGLDLDEAGRPAAGLYRRLAATLHSIAERADGNCLWSTGPADAGERPWWPTGAGDFVHRPAGSFRLRWWSGRGMGTRRWSIEATVTVSVDDWLATTVAVEDVTLTTSRPGGEVTAYRASELGLSDVLAPLVLRMLARDHARTLAGAASTRLPWGESATMLGVHEHG